MSSIGSIGPSFQTSALSGSALQKSAQNHRLVALGLLLEAARRHQELRRQDERRQMLANQQTTPSDPAQNIVHDKKHASEPAAITIKAAQKAQPIDHGDSLVQQLSQLGSAALSFLGVPSTQKLEQMDPTRNHSQNGEQTGISNLSSKELSRGTTEELSPSQRDEALRKEAAQPGSAAEGHTRRNLSTQKSPTDAYAHKDFNSDDNGEVTVNLSPSQARKLGLLGPKEKDRNVSATLPKDVARELGFTPTEGAKKQVTTKAQGWNSGSALSLAGQSN